MNLDKYIKMKMIDLNKKYDISLTEISKIKDGYLKKTFIFRYCLLNDENAETLTKTFYNKREFVSWLLCLT